MMRTDIKNSAKNRKSEFAGQAANIPCQVVNEDDKFNDNDDSDDKTQHNQVDKTVAEG